MDKDIYNNPALPWEKVHGSFENELNWRQLSDSAVLPWSNNIIKKYQAKWYWPRLLENTAIDWNEKLILRMNTN